MNMNLDDLKQSVRDRISHLEQERIDTAQDYDIEGIGTLKLSKIMPKKFYDILMKYGGRMDDEDEVSKNIDMQKEILQASCVDPVLDNDAMDMLIEVLGIEWFQLIARVNSITASDAAAEESVNDVENFSEDKAGPSSELMPA